MRVQVRALLVVLVFVTGCANTHYKDTQVYPAPGKRDAPTFSTFDDCLAEVFSRGRMPRAKLEELYKAVVRARSASFQVPVEGFWEGSYLKTYFVSYISGTQLLVLGRIEKDKAVTQLRAWYVAEPRALPAKPTAAPKKCPNPKCGYRKIKPWHKICARCSYPLRKSPGKN